MEIRLIIIKTTLLGVVNHLTNNCCALASVVPVFMDACTVVKVGGRPLTDQQVVGERASGSCRRPKVKEKVNKPRRNKEKSKNNQRMIKDYSKND